MTQTDHCHETATCDGGHKTTLVSSALSTLHCLVGCAIGEVAGLMIGVSLGIGVFWTVALAVFLAFLVGISLGVIPLMWRENLSFKAALGVIWIGEVISISVMEFVMNAVDLWIGGVSAGSIFAPIFWIGIAFAIPAGFLAAWPVNYWLLTKQLKKCH